MRVNFDGRQHLVTEFVDGATLKGWTNAEKRTRWDIIELIAGVDDWLSGRACGEDHAP